MAVTIKREITTKELGLYKANINKALFKSSNIRELLFDKNSSEDVIMNQGQQIEEFKKHVFSHLFVDDIVTETSTYIYYDVRLTWMRPQIKDCQIVMYIITHRDILNSYSKPGYYGNRVDILAQMIEETLLDESISREFGIGQLQLGSVDVYNSNKIYGRILTFNVPTFR